MGIIGQIILGALLIGVGIGLLIKNYQVTNSIPLSFFEQKMGPGSSYLIWKVISVLFVFAGFLVMFGFYDNFLGWVLSPLTNIFQSNE